jgi:hypothetical protein
MAPHGTESEESIVSETRIYRISEINSPAGKLCALVRAGTQAQAIRHVVRNRFSADVATQDDLVGLLSAGVKVEDAGKEDA